MYEIDGFVIQEAQSEHQHDFDRNTYKSCVNLLVQKSGRDVRKWFSWNYRNFFRAHSDCANQSNIYYSAQEPLSLCKQTPRDSTCNMSSSWSTVMWWSIMIVCASSQNSICCDFKSISLLGVQRVQHGKWS